MPILKCVVCNDHNLMRVCKACGKVWCQSCVLKGGKGYYPSENSAQRCPYCKTRGQIEKAK